MGRPREHRRSYWVAERLTQADFEQIVAEALDSLPERFAALVRNVVVSVEGEPNADDLAGLDDDDGEILGIYRGVALTEREHGEPLLPDEIAIFRAPTLRIARTRKEAVDEVRATVVHELGHYFGLDDQEMPH
jgi:predicted Zn-dependent protease with MMP-like domain